ncbi:MAG TPA: protein phosphatase 2C domain-containing protein [Gallionella sp.]|nr:protein phosphatase 2C domain-containing protein [Gallionella sp.]
MNFSIHQASHIGNRKYNQDRVAYAYSNEALLLVLADGMGGHLHGELAASLTIETFVETFGRLAHPHIADPDGFISNTMRHAHERIMKLPHDRDMGGFPGTTCVAVLVQDDKMHWGHAGDSRLYLLRNGKVIARTRDHSVVQYWFEQGMISAEQARSHPQRNQITHCLGGIGEPFRMERGRPVALQPGDVLLLGSDGLWGPFSDQELIDAFMSLPVTEVLDGLIERALKRGTGHSDNVTGVAVRLGAGETAHNTAEPVSHVLEIS